MQLILIMFKCHDVNNGRASGNYSHVDQPGVNPFDGGSRDILDSSAQKLWERHFVENKLSRDIKKMNGSEFITEYKLLLH